MTNSLRPRELTEDWIEIVKRVTDLVYRPLFVLYQGTVGKEGMLFEKETYLAAGFEKVGVASSVLVMRREDRNYTLRIKLMN